MMNLGNIMKQAQQMQKRLKDAQEELAGQEYTAQAGGGCVTAVCDGQGRFKSIKLTAEAINPENPESVDADTIETLEDLISAAICQASQDAHEKLEAKMKSITGGVNIPGLF